MKRILILDFARSRAQRINRRNQIIAVFALILGLQIGFNVWRWQSLQAALAELTLQQIQQGSKNSRSSAGNLTLEQTKIATEAQAMLNNIAVPWDVLLQSIESARPPRILIETIRPHAQDGTVSISLNSPDYKEVADFVQTLMSQTTLHGVMLTSESLSERGSGVLHAVVQARWGQPE